MIMYFIIDIIQIMVFQIRVDWVVKYTIIRSKVYDHNWKYTILGESVRSFAWSIRSFAENIRSLNWKYKILGNFDFSYKNTVSIGSLSALVTTHLLLLLFQVKSYSIALQERKEAIFLELECVLQSRRQILFLREGAKCNWEVALLLLRDCKKLQIEFGMLNHGWLEGLLQYYLKSILHSKTDLVHETVIVGDIRCIPRSFGRSHFYDTTSQRPDIARPAVAFTAENFGGHKGQGALQLASKLARTCDIGVKTGSGTKITDA